VHPSAGARHRGSCDTRVQLSTRMVGGGKLGGRSAVVTAMELADALKFAGDHSSGVLVTQRRDGRPQLSNVAYALDDGIARISITTTRAKYHNLRRDPWAALHVTRGDFYAYVVLEGDAELSPPAAEPDDATVDELIGYYRQLRGEHPDWDDYRRAMVADGRVIVRLRPTRAYGML
jgi:PPOX class probable F420-dependent enzyme